MPLLFLEMGTTRVGDLTFVRGMRLRSLNVARAPLRDFSPLAGLPVEQLILAYTAIADISFLRGSPLKELDLRGCKELTDLSPVLALEHLETLRVDAFPIALLPLRRSLTLQVVDGDAYLGENFRGERSLSAFWAAFDARQK